MSEGPSRSTTPVSALNAGSSTSRPIRPPVVQPRPARGGTSQSIVVNPCQRGNPVLDAIKNVPWEYGQVVPDYVVGATTGVLFLSLRYHRLHPEYIHTRIAKLESRYMLRVLLMMCDVSEHEEPIRELTKVCLINNLTIMVAWTPEEAGLYLSTYKLFEHKPPDRIKERVDKDYPSLLRAALTSIRGVNKTDVTTLSTNIGSVAEMAEATVEQLLALPGFGEVKSRRVVEAFQRPFRNNPFGEAKRSPWTASQQREETPANAHEATESEESRPTGTNGTRGARTPSPDWGEIDTDEEESTSAGAAEGNKPVSRDRPQNLDHFNQEEFDSIESSDDDARPAKRPRTNGTADASSTNTKPRRESPEWDIELDLN